MASKKQRLDTVAATAIQDNAHLASTDILRRRQILDHEATVLESEASELSARLNDTRRRLRRISSTLNGIGLVLASR